MQKKNDYEKVNEKETSQRRRARELALQVLFQKEFTADLDIKASLSYFRKHLEVSDESLSYAESLLAGIEAHLDEINTIITQTSHNWKISRMAPVDLSLLRIGVYEIYFNEEVPPKVVINEAIEIAKKYGGTESPQFINGLLDEIFRNKK